VSHKKDASRKNVAAMARLMCDEAMDVLKRAMADPDLRIALDAAKHVLDRAIGKPIAMTADVTDKLDELTDAELDATLAAVRGQIADFGKTTGGENPTPEVTH
jgi:hypothetical protein